MGRALVIPGADFSAHKLDTITLTETIPCASLTLSATTGTMTVLGSTLTIVASVLPTNTTDNVQWSSSNENIATVSGGVVTQTGVGTVTITAVCGTFTKTCEISATNVITANPLVAKLKGAGGYRGAGSTYDYGWIKNVLAFLILNAGAFVA